MIITPKDKEMFIQLSASDVGHSLRDFLERLQADVCDSRTWNDGEDKTHANKTARIIQTYIVDNIITRTGGKEIPPYPYK